MSESLKNSNAVGNLTGISMIVAGHVMAYSNSLLDTTSVGSFLGSTALFGIAAAGGVFGVAKIALSCGIQNAVTFWLDRFSTILVILLLANCVWRIKDYTGVDDAAMMAYEAAVAASGLLFLGLVDAANTWVVGKANQVKAAVEEANRRVNAVADAVTGNTPPTSRF